MAEEKLLTKTTETHASHAITREEPRASLLSSTLAIVGFIILIVIVLWGLLHLATLAQPWLASLFNNKTSASIQVSAPANATSGDLFTVSWKYSTSEKGMYALLYQCKNNFRFETPGAGSAMNTIPCGAAFIVPSTGNKTSVKPMLSGTASASIPISIIFMPSATTSTSSGQGSSKRAEGSTTVVIHPAAVVAAPTPVSPTVTPVSPVNRDVSSPALAGQADISVRILSLNTDGSGMATAVFDIANVGGSSSGIYYFTAQLPTSPYAQGYGGTMQSGYNYTSPAQSPLGPGDHVVNTLRFTQAVSGVFSVAVGVSDGNQSNNYASQQILMPYYYPNQYPYPQPYQYQYVY